MDVRSVFLAALFPLLAGAQEKNQNEESQQDFSFVPNFANKEEVCDSSSRCIQNGKEKIDFNRRLPVYSGIVYPRNGAIHLESFGEFLYWTSGYDLNFAIVGQDPLTLQRSLLTFDLDYQPGFRVGLGYGIKQRGWDLCLDWIYFHNHKEKGVHTSNSKIVFLNWISTEDDVNPAQSMGGYQTSTWSLYYNQGELEIGNPLLFSPFYSLRPNAGLRYVHLADGFHLAYKNVNDSSYNDIEMNNKVYGFGFSFGLDNRVMFGQFVFLDFDCKTALIYASSKLKYPAIPSEPQDGFLGSILHKDSHELIPMIEGRIDLGWRRSFSNERWALSLTGGYEYKVLVNGFTAVASSTIVEDTSYPYQKTNLYLHGMNIGAKLNF